VASIRTTLATAGTLAALGGLTAFAVGAGDARPEAEPAGAPAPPEEVRTEVVTRTIDGREPTARAASSRSGGPGSVDDRGRGRGGDDDRGRGGDDVVFDDHRGRGRGRGGDDDGFDDHGDHRGRGRGGDDESFDDHSDDDDGDGGGHGRGGGDDD
jgi:hypothetical protein